MTIPLQSLGRGTLDIHGSWPAKRLLILLNRDASDQDEALVARIIAGLRSDDWTIVRYEAEATRIRRAIARKRMDGWPRPIKRLVKFGLVLGMRGGWRYIADKCVGRTETIEHRVACFRDLVRALGPDKEIAVLGRSAGGRVATMVADELGLRRVVCLSYPFQHPKKPAEPERYAHLAHLKTPFLILQGTQDAYGGREILERYRLSVTTRVEFIEAEHSIRLPEKEWDEALGKVRTFLAEW